MRHTKSTLSRWLPMLLTLLLLFNAGAGVALAASGPAPTHDVQYATTPLDVHYQQETPDNGSSPVPMADRARINPDLPNEDYVAATVEKSDSVFKTEGAFTILALSQPVESARIEQPKARAKVMAGGQVIRVDYADDAAPRDTESLYSLELYFTDGSTKTVELYASHTALSASTSINPAWAETINYLEDKAQRAGYEESPSGALEYIKFKEDRAQILENLWSDTAAEYLTLKLAGLLNPFEWAEIIVILILASIFIGYKNGWILRLQQISFPISAIQREAARQDYEERKNAAAKHPLYDVDQIGTNASRYWREYLNVETIDDMIEIACKGILAEDQDGNLIYNDEGERLYATHGMDDLMKCEPMTRKAFQEKTWLAPIIVEGCLDITTALSNIEVALRVAERDYKRGNEVRKARRQAEVLLEKLSGQRDYEKADTSTRSTLDTSRSPSGSGAAPGGD